MKRLEGKDYWEDRGSLNGLLEGAGSPDPLVRWATAIGLGEYPGARSRDALKRLCSDSDEYVREAASLSLMHLLDEWASQQDEALVTRERPPRWQSLATFAVREMSLWELLALLDDPRPLIRASAARSLGIGEDVRALQRLADLAVTDSDAHVRRACVLAIGSIADRRALELLEEVVEEDDDPGVRAGAAVALGDLSDAEAIDTLSAVVLGDGEDIVRQSACRALGQCARVAVDSAYAREPATVVSQQATDTLREAAEDDVRDVREAALEALGTIQRQTPRD